MSDFITPVPDSDPPQWDIDPTTLADEIYTVNAEGAMQISILFRQFGYTEFADEIDYAIAPRRTTMSAMSDDGTVDGTPQPLTALCDVHIVDSYQVFDVRRWAAENYLDFLVLLDFTADVWLSCRVCHGVVVP